MDLETLFVTAYCVTDDTLQNALHGARPRLHVLHVVEATLSRRVPRSVRARRQSAAKTGSDDR